MRILIPYIKDRYSGTVYDHISSFGRYSSHEVTYLDITSESFTLEMVNKFDVVVLHYVNSIFRDDHCPPWLRLILRNTTAKKVIFIQDEYRVVNSVIANLDYMKINLLFTCVPESEMEKVYPTSKLLHLKKVQTLTGFVPESLLGHILVPYENRPLDVIYRARKLSAWYGRLGLEKWMIAEKFAKDVVKYDLKADISCHEKDRIYGDDWIKFLQTSKAALGVESGANVFDFTGEIQKNVEAYEKCYPDVVFEEVEKRFFGGLDDNIKMNQISPRCFECAAVGTLMILYEGDYSGILKPWRHYVPLKKDHSNVAEVVSVLRNPKKWEEITKHAYAEVAQNPVYSYKNFVKTFDKHAEELFGKVSQHTKIEKSELPILLKSTDLIRDSFSFKIILYDFFLKTLDMLPKSLGVPLESLLKKLKNRLVLSMRTLTNLLQNRDLDYIWLFWKESFSLEYKLILLTRNYLISTRDKLSFLPFSVNVFEGRVDFFVSPENPGYENCRNVGTDQSIRLIFENSWGIPETLRGTEHVMKYKKLIKYLIGL